MAESRHDGPKSVLDLPQLHTKPSFMIILSNLAQLARSPSSFTDGKDCRKSDFSEDGLAAYLTRFISSPLSWIRSDEERERIWEAASQRLSERSGRMAMPSMSRSFSICDFGMRMDAKGLRFINIQLNEPSLTGDNVGHKTWVGSFLMARRLALVLPKHVPKILPISPKFIALHQSAPDSPASSSTSLSEPKSYGLCVSSSASKVKVTIPPQSPGVESPDPVRILELGSGTGLTGMAAAALFPATATVDLTDLPSIVPNLVKNVELNRDLFRGGSLVTAVLDWNDLPSDVADKDKYDCILAADSLYDPEHPGWLTNAMALYLKKDRGARVVVELPFRDMDLPYHDLFRRAMIDKGLHILEQGNETGFDDWEESWCNRVAVTCWWSVWTWTKQSLKSTKDGVHMQSVKKYPSPRLATRSMAIEALDLAHDATACASPFREWGVCLSN